MDASGYDTVVPTLDDPTVEHRPLLDFQAGYVQRGVQAFPRQGSHGPWTVEMSYAADRARLRKGSVADTALRFATSIPMERKLALAVAATQPSAEVSADGHFWPRPAQAYVATNVRGGVT
jgi:monooxygenase